MCLVVINKDVPTERTTVYKVVIEYNGLFLSPFYKFQYKAGWNEALHNAKIRSLFNPSRFIKSEKIKENMRNVSILQEGALHCFYDISSAQEFMTSDWRILLKGYAEPEDFVAWGNSGDIAFKKIYIPQEEFIKALSK